MKNFKQISKEIKKIRNGLYIKGNGMNIFFEIAPYLKKDWKEQGWEWISDRDAFVMGEHNNTENTQHFLVIMGIFKGWSKQRIIEFRDLVNDKDTKDVVKKLFDVKKMKQSFEIILN